MIHQFLLLALLTCLGLLAQSTEKRNQYLKDILEINIARRFQQTTQQVTAQDWQGKREWIKSQYAYWLSGEAPPKDDFFGSVLK